MPTAAQGDEYSYLEDFLDEAQTSKTVRSVPPPKSARSPIANALNLATAGQNDGAAIDPDLMSELGDDEDIDDLYSGSFEN